MSPQSSLRTKNAFAVEFISRYFISQEIGSRIMTISQFEEFIPVARGTIQNSIKMLSEVNAVTIESRGQLGSFLKSKDTKVLLQFAGINFLVGVMPLPYSKIYEGLSTALLRTMENNLNIPVNMAYMRGAEKRIQMVLNQRYDFAIISKFAALKHLEDFDDIRIIQEFKEGSFLSGHVLMFSDKNVFEIKDGMTIGIDKDSIDQTFLTHRVTKDHDVNLVRINYTQLPEKLKNKEIDAAVWNGDEANNLLNDVHSIKLDLEDNSNTIAVVIIDKERSDMETILKELINVKEVEKIQSDVIDGELVPSY